MSRPTLVIVAIGPGEVVGWVLPVAREIRRRAAPEMLDVTLVLTPSQFASGTEAAMAGESGFFTRVISPGTCLRLVLGLAPLPFGRPGALLHLGGDHWFSRRLAVRGGLPAFAYAETERIVRYRRWFQEIFVPDARIAVSLAARGVEAAQVRVVGDPRLDTLPAASARRGPGTRDRHVVLLAGSRARTVGVLLPFWAEAALALRRLRPEETITIAVPPFLASLGAVDAAVHVWRDRLAPQRIGVTWEAAAPAITSADLVITIPGTTTMEVAAVPVTALVVVPTQLAEDVPLEGAVEWIVRVPLVGRPIRKALLRRWLRSQEFVALPNRLSGQTILPELTGVITATRLAEEAAALLADDPRRRRIEEALVAAAGPRGGAARIAEHMLGVLLPRQATAEAGA